MATFLDVTGLAQFSKLFVFVLVLLIVYVVIAVTRVFGESSKGIAWLVAFIIAILVIISPIATGAIAFISPWFALIFVFAIFSGIAVKILGGTDTGIESLPALRAVLVVAIVIALVIGVLAYVRERTVLPGDNDTSSDVGEYTKSVNIIFHPKILGGIAILIVAIFTIALLAGKVK